MTPLLAESFKKTGIELEKFEELFKDLEQVEAALFEEMNLETPLAREICHLTLNAGGKRLRPAFFITSAKSILCDPEPKRLYELAACLEMIHMATLIHDDVIDHAVSRRGAPTSAHKYGNTGSVLAGDVLLSKAMVILAEDGDLDLIKMVSQAVAVLAEGEVYEVQIRNNFELSEKEYFKVLEMKTAVFMACCAKAGAHVGEASSTFQEYFEQYGYQLGMAFQIVDDLLDYRGDPTITGKPRAKDFCEGCMTLPMIRLKEKLNSEQFDFVKSRFGKACSEEDLFQIHEWMETLGAYRDAEICSEKHLNSAIKSLELLPPSHYKKILCDMADLILKRQS